MALLNEPVTSAIKKDVSERKWKGLAIQKMENIALETLNKQLKEQGGCVRCEQMGLNDLAGPLGNKR